MRFDAGVDVATAEKIPFEMFARSAEAIDHWYWGPIVHDMAGIKNKERIPVDWCHDYDEQLGYGDQIEAGNDGLRVLGALVPYGPDDRGREIAHKARAGVPYEASIDWSGGPAVLEFVEFGQETEANGLKFAGPICVARSWYLSAIAICPHGADNSTTTTFAAGSGGEVAISILGKGKNPMSDEQFSKEERTRWREKFGDVGLVYLDDGLTWDQATEKQHAAEVSALKGQLADQAAAFEQERKQFAEKVAGLEAKIGELEKRLSAAAEIAKTDDATNVGADKGQRRVGVFSDRKVARS